MLCLNAGTKYFQRVLVVLSTMSVLLWVEVEFVGAECGVEGGKNGWSSCVSLVGCHCKLRF